MTYTLKDIAIVILNWNGQQLLKQFLPSVVKHSKGSKIYVIDNASTDQSTTIIKKEFPEIKIIQHQQNLGFAEGYNLGLKYIEASILCLLNNDIEVTEGWLQPILKSFNLQEEVAVVQPKILDYNHKSKFEYAGAAGGFIDKFGYPYCRGRVFNVLEKDHGQYSTEQEIFWASGACFFIKASVYKSYHGFDESFFAHMEEIDLCWRIFNDYKNILYNGNSKVFHLGGGTLSKSSAKKTFLNFRNNLLTLTKNASGQIFFLIFTRLVLDGIAGLRFLIKGQIHHCLAIIKAHFSYYWHLPQVLNQRKLHPKKRKDYYSTKSIIWAHFIKKKKSFKAL